MGAVETTNITIKLTNMQNNQILNEKEPQKFSHKSAKTKCALKTTALSVLGVGIAVLGVGIVGALVWYSIARPKVPEGDIVSRGGIHWHPALTISINGQRQIIPANIGIGMHYAGYPGFDPAMGMTDIHTHDDSGTLHWEVMRGPVKKDDIKLGQFFNVWGKQFTSSCIFDKCNGPEGRLKFIINGKENFDFENYLVKDNDKIEIIFE